jgi:preprotein translocase subunit SecG
MEEDGFDNMEEDRSLRRSNNQGGSINYTRDSIVFKEMDDYDKVNYAVFMMRYNVEDKKEVGEGAAEISSVKKAEDLIKISNPKNTLMRIANMLTFVGVVLIIIIFILWISLYIAGIFMTINSIKKTTVFYSGVFLIGLVGITYILDYVYNKAFDRIEILHYYIK